MLLRTATPIRKAPGWPLLAFVASYTLIMTGVYSAIPYKTPWCLLGFLHGMILLAGVGAATLVERVRPSAARWVAVIVLLAGGVDLAWQSISASYRYYADSRNPYVYAHTTTDIFTMIERIEAVSAVHNDGHDMEIHVVCPGKDYWPLPWYLRGFANVGYYQLVTDDVVNAEVVVARADLEQKLLGRLYELPPPGRKSLYVPLFDTVMELRPQVELRGYLRRDLWLRYLQSASAQ